MNQRTVLEQCRSAQSPGWQMADAVDGCLKLVSVYGRPLGELHVLLDEFLPQHVYFVIRHAFECLTVCLFVVCGHNAFCSMSKQLEQLSNATLLGYFFAIRKVSAVSVPYPGLGTWYRHAILHARKRIAG